MQTQVLNYRIIIEPEKQGKKTVYNAYCPTLKVADYGNSINQVLDSIKDGIELAVESLVKEEPLYIWKVAKLVKSKLKES